jgi:mono/diheme cytochrome c family protein
MLQRIENRILVGVTLFVGIMVLVGWVAINEEARMASFERQFHARSIERGAELFAHTCATCHGEDGRGIDGRAPAFNSPHFFGFNYFGEIQSRLGALEMEEAALDAELAELADELVAEGTSNERMDEILERRVEISERLTGEEGIAAERAILLEEMEALVIALEPAIDRDYPIRLDVDEAGNEFYHIEHSRLEQLAWGGTLHDFVFTTLVHGRPTSISYWPEAMQSFSQRTGGPLRDDELDDIANYILNWDRGTNWTIEDALAVNQYAQVPGVGLVDVELQPPAGADAESILARIEEQGIEGDPVRGGAVYSSAERSGRADRLGCAGCHEGGVAAPDTAGTWDRVVNVRLQDPELAGYTPERYLVQSIVQPGFYTVEGYASGVMPGNFGQRMTLQDIADIIEYLRTQTDE